MQVYQELYTSIQEPGDKDQYTGIPEYIYRYTGKPGDIYQYTGIPGYNISISQFL